jgi:Spy/CpxP family protein refolding chaperone
VIGIRRWAEEMRQRPDLFSNRVLTRMESDLKLTKGQKAELSKIFKSTREELDEVRSQHRVQAQAFFKDFHDQVAQVLTPTQQKEWEEWWKRARERAFKERSGGPPRPQGGDKERQKEMKSPEELKQRDGAAAAPERRPEPPQGIPEQHFGSDPAAPTPEKEPEPNRVPSPN